MYNITRSPLSILFALLAVTAIPLSLSNAHADPLLAPAPAAVFACRVLETHTSQTPAVTVVVFHQQDAKDRAALAALLRQHSESSVEFQTSDGAWHPATVVRLKSCFGRGLLIFPAGSARLEEKEGFVLKFWNFL